jgi:hypothetical protein
LLSSYSVGVRDTIRTLQVSYAKVFVALACCLVIGLAGCGFSSNAITAGILSVSPGSISFGAVPVGQTATTNVLLLNGTSAPVAVSQVNVSGQNFFLNSQSTLPATINAGSVANFQIGFKPGNSSTYSGQFIVMGPGGKQIYVGTISGQGVGANGTTETSVLTVSAANLAFGNLTVGSAASQSVTLASTGTAPVTISSATLSGTGFTLSGGAFPDRLNPGQSLTLSVKFDPTTAGAAAGQLAIQSDSATNSTAVVSLSGTGMPPVESPPVGSPQLTLSATTLTFGNVTVNTPSKQPVTLTSTGTVPVTINSGTLTGNGFTMSGATFPVTLNPNQSVTLNVQFDPGATGPASGQLTIQSNSSTNSTAVVNLSGTGSAAASPQLTLSAASLTFGDVTVNSASTLPETLTSSGTAPVTINSATPSGLGFTVSGAAFPVTLNPGQSVTLKVQFDPTAAGAASGQLTLQSNSSTNGTAVVNLSGTGSAAASPQLTLSAGTLTFGNVTVNTASTQPVTLTSSGTAPVTVNSAALTGTGFTMSGATFPVTLNPNQSVTLNVQFDPTATGAASGQLTIESDSSTNSTAIVSLSGTGTAATSPQLTLSAASLTFGDVTVNTASTQPVTLSSTGTAPVTINSAATSGTAFTVSGATFPVTLNPGQSVTLKVQFEPTATGAATDQLTIQSDSSTNSTAVVGLSGTGTAAASPQLTLSAVSLMFGDVTLNTASTQPVTLSSSGTAPVTINSETLAGTGFTVSGATFPVTLNPGQSVTLNVQFDPTATGAASGQLTIQSDSSTNSAAVVNLSGTGTAAVAPNAQLTISPLSLAFGSVTLNTPTTLPVTLTASGTAPVTVNSAALTGTGFTVSGATFPVTLSPTQSVTLNVQFDPAATGAVTGQLTIQSNSSTNGTAVVNLSGTGTATVVPPNAQLTISPLSLAFGNVTLNTPTTLPVTLTASGTAPVTVNSAALTGTGFTMSGATFPVTLSPTQSVTLNVQFDPAATGAVTGQLTIQSNSSTNGTAVVNLSGTGTAIVVPNPQLTISPLSLAFGNVTLNTPTTLPVTLTAGATAPVTINSAALTGTGFTMSGATFPVTLSPAQSVTLNVQFHPAATGAVTGQLTIQSNSSTNGTAVVNLSGTGTATVVPATLSSVSCSSASLTGAGSDSCTVTLSSAAGSGGVSVGLSSSSTAVTVPATVVVPANATSAGFTATATSVTTAQSVTLTASADGVSKTFALQLNAAVPQLTISPLSLAFGNVTLNTPTTLTVTLTAGGTAPVTVNSAALTGTGFTMSGATFPVTLNPTQSATVNVRFDPAATGAVTGQLTIQSNSSTNGTTVVGLSGTGTAVAGTLSSVSCNSASLTGAGSDSCTVTLSSAAGSGGVSVGVSSSSTAVTVPATLVVPANATSAGFTATVTSVTTAQSVTLTASTGGVSKTFALQLNPAVPTLTVSPVSLAFGNVTVNTPTTLPVTMTSSGTAPVIINSATLSGTGFTMSGATFPLTLNPGLAVTLEVQLNATATGALTGQLVIQSNSSTNATVTIGLSGTAGNASHQVTLTWDAPSSSTDPVAGYNVYRAAAGSSAYTLLNSSVDTQTTYVDTNVQSGSTYDYVVKSVDASGVESTASNEAAATIP